MPYHHPAMPDRPLHGAPAAAADARDARLLAGA